MSPEATPTHDSAFLSVASGIEWNRFSRYPVGFSVGSMQLNLLDSAGCVRWCEEHFAAYFECRRNKRNTPGARAFERHFECELFLLAEQLADFARERLDAETFARVHPGAEERLERAAA
jgi:hypothetical protein